MPDTPQYGRPQSSLLEVHLCFRNLPIDNSIRPFHPMCVRRVSLWYWRTSWRALSARRACLIHHMYVPSALVIWRISAGITMMSDPWVSGLSCHCINQPEWRRGLIADTARVAGGHSSLMEHPRLDVYLPQVYPHNDASACASPEESGLCTPIPGCFTQLIVLCRNSAAIPRKRHSYLP